MRVGFIGLGNVGGKLSGSLLRNGTELAVHDLNPELVANFVGRGAVAGGSAAQLMQSCDVVITCLPSPAASAASRLFRRTDAELPGRRAEDIAYTTLCTFCMTRE